MTYEEPHGKVEIFRPGRSEPEPEMELPAERRRRLLKDLGLTLFGLVAFALELLPFYLAIWP